MRFLLDESADWPLAGYLLARGHEVTAIAHGYPASLPDTEVLAVAVAEGRILITNDRDFGELIVRRGLPHRGIIFFRLGDESIETKCAWLELVLSQHSGDLDALITVTDHGIRVRPKSSA